MIEQTQCDGIMVAVGLGNHVAYSQIKDYLKMAYTKTFFNRKDSTYDKNFHYEEEIDLIGVSRV